MLDRGSSIVALRPRATRRLKRTVESIQTLLKNLPPSTPATSAEDPSTTPTSLSEPIPTTSKLPHIISIHPDLLETTHLLTQLQILVDQDVSGGGSLVQGYALDQGDITQARLTKVQRVIAERSRAGSKAEGEGEGQPEELEGQVTQADNLKRMVELLTRWDDFVSL
jgi:hypothetical protein